jgi:hypothetical protein
MAARRGGQLPDPARADNPGPDAAAGAPADGG